ncbi:MAG: hypothetical protein Q7S40_12355 [Opitutaceae bacterium]|nr:hypothetical protein [Opitutaceae bacterium]
MSFDEWRESIGRDKAPPRGSSLALQALWHDAHGDWECAHNVAQDDKGRDGSWVHAYLHRKEGDLANAGYWYARAGRAAPAPKVGLAEEWAEIARTLFGRG